MVRPAFIASLILSIVLAFVSPSPLSARRAETDKSQTDRSMSHITIRIGDRAFGATLLDNATADAFKKLLPLSLTMTELNGNEKFARLPVSLPTQKVEAPIDPDRRPDALWLEHSGSLLRVLPNHVLQLLEDRPGG